MKGVEADEYGFTFQTNAWNVALSVRDLSESPYKDLNIAVTLTSTLYKTARMQECTPTQGAAFVLGVLRPPVFTLRLA